jgi:hypothetical protein
METDEISSIIHAGVVFAVYLFIMIACYYFLSSPVNTILAGIIDATPSDVTDEMALLSPNLIWAVKAAFAIGIAIPATWFVFWVFSKEPFIGIRRY